MVPICEQLSDTYTPLDLTDELKIVGIIENLVKQGEAAVKAYKLVGERNEDWYHGKQITQLIDVPLDDSRYTAPPLKNDLPQNLLRNLINTWKARILTDRPHVKVWPAFPTPVAEQSAQVANDVLKNLWKDQSADRVLDDVVRMAGLHGVAGLKICYSPDADRVEWHKLTIWDFYVDPRAESFTEAAWVVFRVHLDPFQAKDIFMANGIQEDPPVTKESVNNSEEREGTELFEVWHKPCSHIPEGLYCKKIGNHVFDVRPYPYLFRDLEDLENGRPTAVLPLVFMKVDYRRGTPYADTWLSDVIGSQRTLNETDAALAEIRRKTAGVQLIVPDEDTAKKIRASKSQIIIGQLGTIGYAPSPQAAPILFADRDYSIKSAFDRAGLNEQLVGAENFKAGTSAKYVEAIAKQDAMKHRGTMQSLEEMEIAAARLSLQLVQMYYLETRIMRIANDGGGFSVKSFKGADVQGITLDVEAEAGLQLYHANDAASAETDAQAGWIQPQQAIEARDTGSVEPWNASITRTMVQLQAKATLQGATPQVDPSIDAGVAAAELQHLIAELEQQGIPGPQLQALTQLAQLYAQAAAPPPQQPPGPPPGAPQLTNQPQMGG